jgi:hypothetical protein
VAFGLQHWFDEAAEIIFCEAILRDVNEENNLQKSGEGDLKTHYPSNANQSASGFSFTLIDTRS